MYHDDVLYKFTFYLLTYLQSLLTGKFTSHHWLIANNKMVIYSLPNLVDPFQLSG